MYTKLEYPAHAIQPNSPLDQQLQMDLGWFGLQLVFALLHHCLPLAEGPLEL